MKELKHIDSLSMGILLSFIFALFGLFTAVLLWIGIIAMPGMGSGTFINHVIVFPCIYGLIGFVTGILSTIIYNFVAKWVGGIKVQFDDIQYEIKSEQVSEIINS